MSSRGIIQSRKGTVQWKGKVEINFKVVQAFFETHLPSAIIIRTQKKSVDKYGASLGVYSTGYARRRAKMGESTDKVGLRLTGGLLNSIRARDSVIKKNSITTFIGAGANPSKVVRPPADGGFGRWEIDTSKIGPRYNQILYWLGPGARGKKRDILGFTRREADQIGRKLISKNGILKKSTRR